MNLDFREVLVCFVTVLVVAAATIVAVGAVATYSFYVHAISQQRDAAYPAPAVLASTIDPCLGETTFAARPVTPVAESGLQCPIFRVDQG